MIGHSVGEYVAATLAGVMTLEDALRLIARRGQLISALPRGSMLAVMAPAETIEPTSSTTRSRSRRSTRRDSRVLSGPDAAIERVEATLAARVDRGAPAAHLARIPLVDDGSDPARSSRSIVAGVRLSPPTMPFVATLTGKWADGEVTHAGYWSAQLRSTVRFADGLRALVAQTAPLGKRAGTLEVGPGNTLTTFASETRERATATTPLCLTSLPAPDEQRAGHRGDRSHALGQLWANGVAVDWASVPPHGAATRVSLPTYPFERQSYWIGRTGRERAAAEQAARHLGLVLPARLARGAGVGRLTRRRSRDAASWCSTKRPGSAQRCRRASAASGAQPMLVQPR